MSTHNEHIAQLKDELRTLQAQLKNKQESVILDRAVYQLYEHWEMVSFVVKNDEKYTVSTMSNSFSSYVSGSCC